MDKFSELKAAAAKYSAAFNAHRENPTDKGAMYAWDEASSEFDRAVNHNEMEIILALLTELEASKKSNAFLKEQLAKLANFNPDWDMLEACRESWREVAAALKESEARLESKDKRIAELEQEPTIKHMRSVEEALIHATDMVSELEAKLATPVRLPDVLFIKVSGSAVPVMHAGRVKERLRAAGFTVEGDE
ncbi:hypothetical protein M0K91_RS23500 [Serratia marcescens]|uniref:hypothetical protein n=1 Tax=Serratia marcescens TaxID=615 RepID=UPI003F7D544C|nr:hypothetical protein [Serratia marcescens]